MSWLFGFSSSSSAPADTEELSTPSSTKAFSTLARRDRTAEGPTFSSAKCPPGSGLENSCELPFGFVWTPMADIPKRPKQQLLVEPTAGSGEAANKASTAGELPVIECPTSSLPPVLCLTCLAYLNPYVEVNYRTGVWTCSLCGSENVLPKRLIGSPSSVSDALLTPALRSHTVEYHQPLPLPPPRPQQEGEGGGNAKHDGDDDVCTIVLVVDANLDRVDAHGMIRAVEQLLPDLASDGRDGDDDDEWSTPHPKIQLGLVVFDETVAMYQLGIAGVASADMYTSNSNSTDEDGEEEDADARQMAMEQGAYLQSITSKADLQSLSQCISAVFGVVAGDDDDDLEDPSSLRSPTKSRMQVLKQKKEARMRQEELQQQGKSKSAIEMLPKESPWIQKRNMVKSTHSQRRCTGEALHMAMDLASVAETRTSRILLFTNGCPNVGEGSVVVPPASGNEASKTAASKVQSAKKGTKTNKKKKHDVVDTSQMSKAIQYYDLLANLAMEQGIAVDVFCAGAMELGLPAYQALVEPSGGYVLPHLTFDSPHLAHNLTFCLKCTYVSRTLRDIPMAGNTTAEDKPKSRLARLFSRNKTSPADEHGNSILSECVLDIRCDSFVVPTHLVGPGELVDASSLPSSKNKAGGASRLLRHEKAAFAEGSKLAAAKDFPTNNLPSGEALDLSLTRIQLPRFDPLATVSVMVQVNDTIVPDEDDHAFFQTTARFISRDGKTMITRVSTHRFPVASSVSDYVKNADDEVVSVLLAKSAVYRSLHGREETDDTKDKIVAGDPETLEQLAYDAQLDLDATVQRISGAFRLLGLEEKTRSIDLESGSDEKKEASSPSSSLDFAFPPQLSEGLRRLYHLRRGALISPGPMRSMDDRAEGRQLFLRFPLEDCVGMMAPKLWSTGNLESARSVSTMQSLNPFPAETMALWDASIIACDQHDVQFVWSGKICAQSNPFNAVRDKFQKFLEKEAKNRFPMPEIHMLMDGDSMSRRFTTRLAPSHADSPEQQMANFPDLSSLSPASLESLRSKFRFYDAAADASFRKWFWSVSSATHASREDGMSLCE